MSLNYQRSPYYLHIDLHLLTRKLRDPYTSFNIPTNSFIIIIIKIFDLLSEYEWDGGVRSEYDIQGASKEVGNTFEG